MSEVKFITRHQLLEYQRCLRQRWDEQGIKDAAFEEGKKEVEKAIKEAKDKGRKNPEKRERKGRSHKTNQRKSRKRKDRSYKKIIKNRIFAFVLYFIQDIQKSMQLKGEL